jgi:hypothetical protein
MRNRRAIVAARDAFLLDIFHSSSSLPKLSCSRVLDGASGVRAHCCRGLISRMTRQEKSCRSDEQARGRRSQAVLGPPSAWPTSLRLKRSNSAILVPPATCPPHKTPA